MGPPAIGVDHQAMAGLQPVEEPAAVEGGNVRLVARGNDHASDPVTAVSSPAISGHKGRRIANPDFNMADPASTPFKCILFEKRVRFRLPADWLEGQEAGNRRLPAAAGRRRDAAGHQ